MKLCRNANGPVFGPATNIRGEILAIIKAIEIAEDARIRRLEINTDSEFVIKSIEEWLPNWIENGWRLANGNPVKNQDLFRQLDDALDSEMEITFSLIEAHSGQFGNDEADRLAKGGAQQYNGFY